MQEFRDIESRDHVSRRSVFCFSPPSIWTAICVGNAKLKPAFRVRGLSGSRLHVPVWVELKLA